jgi:RNA polymerase sigma-70 factor (ECF subfamily)
VRGIDARTTPDDDALVDRLRRGDRDAFELLVRRYHGSLTRIAMGYVSTRQGAEELAQDAWMGVLQGLERFEGRSSFRTWLFAILVNRAKTRGLREGRTLPFSAIPGPDSPGEPDVPPSRFDTRGRWAEPPAAWRDATPEALLVGAETRRALSDAIAALPDNYRIVLTLRDLEGLDAEDVCRVLGISESNQRVLLHRARSKVRQALEAHFTAK